MTGNEGSEEWLLGKVMFTKLYLVRSLPCGVLLISDFEIVQMGSDSHFCLHLLPRLITTGL